MAMPPIMDSHKLFAQLASTVRPNKIVPFPRNNPETNEPVFNIAMVIMTTQDAMIVSAAAEKMARQMLKDNVPNKEDQAKGYDQIFNNVSAIETLYRVCRDPEDLEKKVFPSPKAISDVLTTDEIAILLNHYFTVQVELGPIVGSMTDDEIEAWIQKLAEGGQSSVYFLNSFSWEALKELVIAMAVRSWTSQMDKSLPTGQPEEVTSNESKKKTKKSKTSSNLPESLSLMTSSDITENLTLSNKE